MNFQPSKNRLTTYPPVSIALCTYNGAAFLAQQLETILNQTYPNITEVVCVDDCSSDETFSILNQFALRDGRIHVFQNSSNLGYIRNFEKALTLTKEPFIALSDQDDLWYPTKIARSVAAIGTNLLVYSDSEYINEQGKKTGKKLSDFRRLGVEMNVLNLALFNVVAGHTIMIRRELLVQSMPFHPQVPHDYWLAFQAIKCGNISFVDEVLVGYRQHTTNVIGALGSKNKYKHKATCQVHERLAAFSDSLKGFNTEHQVFLRNLSEFYSDLTWWKKIRKVSFFWKHQKELLHVKRRNVFRKRFYCVQMYWRDT
jgi:glycosyltransferase involved in cell wall biosynthesis